MSAAATADGLAKPTRRSVKDHITETSSGGHWAAAPRAGKPARVPVAVGVYARNEGCTVSNLETRRPRHEVACSAYGIRLSMVLSARGSAGRAAEPSGATHMRNEALA